ncbi:MAG: hypothetical protein QOK42_2412 [Frankiaceae bacterium]|jgi:hypothetical protein|nr:hypothetical protein [Frankiaceae bacterium]MDX6274561.1 hypothetical protein [Frankiales bacterium]
MSTHPTLPSEVEPTTIGDLIDDCRALADGAVQRVIDLTGSIPVQRVSAPLVFSSTVFTDKLRSMVDGFGQ